MAEAALVAALLGLPAARAAPLAGARGVARRLSASAAVDGVAPAMRATRERLDALAVDLGLDKTPRLVAVSKTKPVELLMEAYNTGQRDFGENYAQDLMAKAPALPADVRWRFIGALQSNKAKPLVHGVANLVCVETVDRLKVARALDSAVATSSRAATPLSVLIQVNTSGEDSKSGVPPAEAADLAAAVAADCAHLRVEGLMTIGAPRPDLGDDPDPDFDRLKACRSAVAARLGVEVGSLELSMGMSTDWERAVRQGSTSVRVGSAIFGARA